MPPIINTIVYQYMKKSLKNTCQCATQRTVIISLDYLGCDVVRSTTECGGLVFWTQPLLAHPVVRQLYVAVLIQQDIV